VAAGDVGLELVLLWVLAGLGVYHLICVARASLRRALYRAQSVRDPSNQLRFVMAADFSKKKVMGFEEYRVFTIVEDEVRAYRSHRVFAQTSLGEVLQAADNRAHSSINSKRVDVLVVTPKGYPLLAVEYQGGGHYRHDAAARDAVKREALRKAGVGYLEISKSCSEDEIRRLVRQALVRAASSPGRLQRPSSVQNPEDCSQPRAGGAASAEVKELAAPTSFGERRWPPLAWRRG